MGKFISLIGQIFGELTVIGQKPSDNGAVYLCQCSCGNTRVVKAGYLRNGSAIACNDCAKQHKDMSGMQVGYLTIIKRIGNDKHKKIIYECQCECGNIINVSAARLKGGYKPAQKSCGKCGKNPGNTKHGMHNTPEYVVYCGIKSRCYNVNNISYPNYGGRGIKMDDRWLGEDGFINFYEDMGPRPSDDSTVERMNNNLNYGKDNCKWATWEEQNRNSRHNVLTENLVIEIRDKYNSGTYTVQQLAEEYDISPSAIHAAVTNKSWKDI